MRLSILIILIIGSAFLVLGCGNGPKEKDVKRSVFSIMRGFETSTNNIEPELVKEYGNGADLKFVAKNETLINEMRILLKDDNTISYSGACNLVDYKDRYSGYIVNGELIYDCIQASESYIDCEFSCDAEIIGGEVETIGFGIQISTDGLISIDAITANGEDVEFNQWDFIKKIIQAFDPKLNI